MIQKIVSFLTLFLLSCALPVSADWQDEVNSGAAGPYAKVRPVNLSYAASWNGKIKSGRINFLFGRKDQRYPNHLISQAWGGSRGVAKGLFPYEFKFTSFLNKKTLHPFSFTGIETDKKKTRKTDNIYRKSVETIEVSTPPGRASTTKKKSFSYSKSTVYDLFSAILYMRSLDLKTGDEKVLVVQAFDTPYLARVKAGAREPHKGRNCIRLDLKLQKIDPDTLKLKSYKKMKSLSLWITDDHERLPIEIRSKLFIGDVRLVLDGREYLK